MKILRSLSRWLVPAALLIVVLVAAALAPMVQTWAAQLMLAQHPELQGSLGWVTARFGKMEVSDLKLTLDGAVLTVPSLEARLPLMNALVNHRFTVRRLVAKGWKLDLNPPPAPAAAAGATAPTDRASPVPPPSAPSPPAPSRAPSAEEVARAVLGMLRHWTLPCDLSLDGVDLEGDVLVAARTAGSAAPVHVIIKGGGMAAGREGEFALNVATSVLDAKDNVVDLSAHGRLLAGLATPRTFSRLEVIAEVTADGGPFPNGVAVTADVAESMNAGEETYAIDLRQRDRHLATFAVRYSEKTDRLAGTWKADLQDSDLAPLGLSVKLPHFAGKGEGEFETDLGFTQVHALGRLNATVSQLRPLVPWLARLDPSTLEAAFDVRQSGKTLHVDRLSASLTGERPVIILRSLQPFEVDEATGGLNLTRAEEDWLELSVRGVPTEWLADVTSAFSLAGGEAAGEFSVRTAKGGFDLRSKAPVTASGVSLQCGGRTLGRNLDLSVSLTAADGPQGWTIEAAPLKVGGAGGPVGEVKLLASRPAAIEQPTTIRGSWMADLQAPAFRAAVADLGGIGGRTASGDFSVSVGEAVTEVEGKVAFAGRDEHRTVTASVQGSVDPGGRVSFKAPLKIALGSSVSDFSVEGTVLPGPEETGLYLKVSGKSADLEHLRRLTGVVAAAEGLPLAAIVGRGTPSTGRDTVPFWGNWSGRILVELERLTAGPLALAYAAAVFQVDHRSLRIEEGRATLGEHHFNNVAGSVAFDPAAAKPYTLKASAAVEPIEVGSFFPPPSPTASPAIEGRFSFTGTANGEGINLADLLQHTQEEFRLASTAGIVRIFKTDVDEAIPPDTESAAADTMGRMGTAFGKFFGLEDADRSARKKVSPTLQAALDVVNQTAELGLDQCSLTAVRTADGGVRLTDLVLVAGDERITGSGQVSPAPGQPFAAQPVTLELQVGARGHMAKLFDAAGLLSSKKDDQGYQLLTQPLVFGGTVGRMDNRQWHELLVKSARRQPPAAAPEPAKRH